MKRALSILLIIPACLCKAQTGERVLAFNKGDEFEKKTFIVSACQLQQGAQVMNINSTSAVSKLYKVDNANSNGFSFTVTTSEIADTINSMGQQMNYHSRQPADTSSVIQTAFDNIINHPLRVNITNRGIITSVSGTPMQNGGDVIFAYAGLQLQPGKAGDELGLTTDFTLNPQLAKGFSWTDSSEKDGNKTVITYTIQSIREAVTTISFAGTIAEHYFNTNISGALMIDNVTGVIVQRAAETASTGYDIFNGVAYTEIRRTSLAEYCTKRQ